MFDDNAIIKHCVKLLLRVSNQRRMQVNTSDFVCILDSNPAGFLHLPLVLAQSRTSSADKASAEISPPFLHSNLPLPYPLDHTSGA